MAGGGQFSGGLLFRDHAVDNPRVLAVDAADASQGFQFFQGPVEVPVPQEHGGVGHVHFKRGDTLGEHVGKLPADVFVPVVDGHVEAVIAEGLPCRLFPPALQSAGEGFALVGAGEVNDGSGTAPESGAASGGEAVGGDGAGDLQVKVGVGVDEAGKEDAAGDVHHPVGLLLESPSDGGDFFVPHQDIGPPDALSGGHGAAFE